MMHFDRPDEPPGFDANVRRKGADWLSSHPDAKRPRDYWSPYRPKLAEGFKQLCAYTSMYEPVGTVDHFISCDEDRAQAYEWSNYRFAAQWVNSSKRKASSLSVLDPFEVQDGWFEIQLPSLQLVLTDVVPNDCRERAEVTLKLLHLRDDERVLSQRRHWYAEYQRNQDLEVLRVHAPLIARAVEKAQQASGIATVCSSAPTSSFATPS